MKLLKETLQNETEIYIENKKITSEHSVRLLGIEINSQLNFDNHVSTLSTLRKYIGFPEKKALMEAFVFSDFNYFPLV